jgi:hypothetical protein
VRPLAKSDTREDEVAGWRPRRLAGAADVWCRDMCVAKHAFIGLIESWGYGIGMAMPEAFEAGYLMLEI